MKRTVISFSLAKQMNLIGGKMLDIWNCSFLNYKCSLSTQIVEVFEKLDEDPSRIVLRYVILL